MFITRKRSIRVIAPFALAGALVFTGCSASAPTPAVDSSAVDAPAETESATDFEIVMEDTIMTGDAELDAQLADLSAELKATAAPGITLVMVNAYTTQEVSIQLWTDDDAGVLSADQLKPVLDALQAFTPVTPIDLFTVNGWDREGMQGESNGAATDLGVKAEFIDAGWWNVAIPGDQVQNMFG